LYHSPTVQSFVQYANRWLVIKNPAVIDAIREKTSSGLYPDRLWEV